MILLAGLGTAMVMAVVAFVLPSWYTATTSVFPPETKSSMPPMYSDIVQSLQLPSIGPSANGSRPSTIYIDVMRSRRVGENLLEEFNLFEAYETSTTVDAH